MSLTKFDFRQNTEEFNKLPEVSDETDKVLTQDSIDIIKNITKYLRKNGLDEFLEMDPSEERLIEFNPDDIYGNQDSILEILRDATIHEDELLNDVERRSQSINQNLKFYNGFLLEDKLEVKAKKLKQKKALLTEQTDSESSDNSSGNESESDYPSSSDISDRIKQTGIQLPSSSRSKKVISDTSMSKNIEGIMFVGFDNNELTELPGFQEAPQLLNNLSLKMGFKDSFMKYWSAIIRSEASNAILQDAFWWFYLKNFKKDNLNLERDAYKYFCRISDSFTALFLSVDSSLRDRFFSLYANFLSQAVYTIFYRAFPDSRLQFGNSFKENLCDTIFEWIVGVKAIPGIHKQWVINPEIDVNNSGDIKVTSSSEIMAKISNLEKFLSKLGNKEEESKPMSPEKTKKFVKKSKDVANKSLIQFYDKNESHIAQEGAIVEKFSFNLKGQSILVAHYLNMRNLQDKKILGPRVVRSQIVQQPDENDKTYKDIIYQSMEKAKNLENKFKELQRVNEAEIKKLKNEQHAAKIETKRLQEQAKIEEKKSKTRQNKAKNFNPLKVTKPVPTTHKLKAKRLSFNDELSSRADDASLVSESVSDRSSEVLSKDNRRFSRPHWDLREEDEYDEY